MISPTERFSDKVVNYIRYRPGYPVQVLDAIQGSAKLANHAIVADVGSGTGIFSKVLLDAGYKVYGVEPNDAMRTAAEALLKEYPSFHSVNGTGEETTIAAQSVDMIVCATAFHWLDMQKAKEEFNRILKRGGKVALIWNVRVQDRDDFSIALEALWKHQQKEDKNNMTRQDFDRFFTGSYEVNSFKNEQRFDLVGLIGRSFSSSFSPAQESTEGQVFLNTLTELFHKYQMDNAITIYYETKLYLGNVS